MEIQFTGCIWFWKGPGALVLRDRADGVPGGVAAAAAAVTYGWGMIPVVARIGETRWKISLFPKDGSYIVPLKAVVRRAEKLGIGDKIAVTLSVGV